MIKLKDIPQSKESEVLEILMDYSADKLSNIKRFYALFGISMAGVNKADAEKQMEALLEEMNA